MTLKQQPQDPPVIRHANLQTKRRRYRAARTADHEPPPTATNKPEPRYQVPTRYPDRRYHLTPFATERLARLARLDAKLLSPIQHRGAKAQADLARIRSRDALVQARTSLVVHVRGSGKAFGARLPSGSPEGFPGRARKHLPAELRPALEPVIATIAQLNEAIKRIEKELEVLAKDAYPETVVLRQVPGVGLLTSLAFILTLEDPARFERSREVGPYLGLTPGQHQSGNLNPKQRITKHGDQLLRRLLVQCAHHTIRSKTDSDLQRAGLRLMARGAHRAKAVTAIARKLAVLLHHLWSTGELYEPLRNHQPAIAV